MIRTLRFSAALLGVLLVAACQNDQLNRAFANTPVDPLFARYVSMGNSITAGFQSGGINDSTQQQSYAVVLAKAMPVTRPRVLKAASARLRLASMAR